MRQQNIAGKKHCLENPHTTAWATNCLWKTIDYHLPKK